MLSAPPYTGPKSDHFDGTRFVNPRPVEPKGLKHLMKFMFGTKKGVWKKTENKRFLPPNERVTDRQIAVTYINHATVLIQMDGLNILTDPIWSDRCSPVKFAGPKRIRKPGLSLEALPPLDLVIVSHNHYDHCDLPTLKKLCALHPDTQYITSLGNKQLLERIGLTRVTELDWQDTATLNDKLTITALPAQHFSGRGFADRMRTLWMSCMLTGPSGHVYFGADTGMAPHFKHIAALFSPIRLAIIPIGAYLPRWFMADVHLSPDEAVEAVRILKAETSIAIHFGTFELGADGQYQAVEEMHAALDALDPADRPDFRALDFGECLTLAADD